MIRGLVTTAFLTVTCWAISGGRHAVAVKSMAMLMLLVKSTAMLRVLVGIMGDD